MKIAGSTLAPKQINPICRPQKLKLLEKATVSAMGPWGSSGGSSSPSRFTGLVSARPYFSQQVIISL